MSGSSKPLTSEGRILPLRVGTHGLLGCHRAQEAVVFSRNLIGTGAGGCLPFPNPAPEPPVPHAYPLSVRVARAVAGRRPVPVRPLASRPRRELVRPTFDQTDFIFDTADGVLAVDREQRIVLWNDGAEALLGFKAEEVLGKYCHEVLGGRDDSGCLVCQAGCADLTRTLRRERVRTRDLLVCTKAGRDIWLNVSTIRVGSRSPELGVLVHLFRDVNHPRDMERFIEQLRSIVTKLSLSHGADPPTAPPSHPPPTDLTRREDEILRLLASGASTRAIAKKLSISPATVRNHIHHLLTKLGAHSRLEAVTLALRNSLI